MTNLWAFMLLGFLPQASNVYVQISYNSLEEELAKIVIDITAALKGKLLFDFDVMPPPNSVTAKSVNVDDATVTSTDTVFNSEGIMSMKATGSVTLSSKGFSTAVYWIDINLKNKLLNKDGFSYWDLVPESFSLSTESANSITCHLRNGTDVVNAYTEKSQLIVKGLYKGAIHSAITAMNTQNAKLTENFKYNVLTCQYTMDHYKMYPESIGISFTLSCGKMGLLNDAESLVPNKMNSDETLILYIEEKLCNTLLASVAVNYKGIVTEAEWNGAFSHPTGDLWISFTSNSLPVCSMSTAESKATFPSRGSIKDASDNELVDFTFSLGAAIYVRIINGIVKPSLGAAQIDQLTPTSAVENCDCDNPIAFLKPIILRHLSQVVNNLNSKLTEFKAPDPLGVTPNNADCSTQGGQIRCVQM